MLRAWLARLFGPAPRPAPRLYELLNRIDDLESRFDYLLGEVKKLRGRLTGALRHQETAQDAPGDTNGGEEVPQQGVTPMISSAHLARRFRGF